MARWSPTVLPYAPDPFAAGDRIARGVYGGVQLDQSQQRIDEATRRGDIMENRNEWALRQAEAGMMDQYGWRGEGAAPEPTPDDSQAGGSGSQPTEPAPSPETQGIATPSQGITPERGEGGAPLGGQNPMHRGPQYSAGDVRNQPEVVERLQMATGGSIAPMGHRPTDQYQAQQRRETGGKMFDAYGEMLGLDPRLQGLMEHTGGMPPIMQPHQTAGYGSAEEMGDDAYQINRVNPSVLSALIRAKSAEGGGGLTGTRQNDILTARFQDAVSNYMLAERQAGREVTIDQAYNHVMQSNREFRGANTSMLDIAGDWPDMYGVGNLGGIAIPVGEGGADPFASGLVEEVMMSGNIPATLSRIELSVDPETYKQVAETVGLLQKIQWMQRFGMGAAVGGG